MWFNIIFLLNATVIEICNKVLLVGTVVASEEDAFSLYNDFAFRLGFSVRKDKQKFKAGSNMKYLKQFYYHKQEKQFDIQTDCKAMIEFCLNNEGGWTVSSHNASHNHGLYVANERHLMRSQRGVTKNNADYLQELKNSGVVLRILKKQVGGSPFVRFTSKDAYNSLR
ncbi:hypothetical protein M9H77_16095 [Catharanthus roseus]|uniref:Uncharacterized protein n=1 Tax=Catharanthus roseus TaxID=4058 RepID=A0ACC0B107_CATRO|nr:hypothetical protein M9H77_16095 [Catharanthus roseus]